MGFICRVANLVKNFWEAPYRRHPLPGGFASSGLLAPSRCIARCPGAYPRRGAESNVFCRATASLRNRSAVDKSPAAMLFSTTAALLRTVSSVDCLRFSSCARRVGVKNLSSKLIFHSPSEDSTGSPFILPLNPSVKIFNKSTGTKVFILLPCWKSVLKCLQVSRRPSIRKDKNDGQSQKAFRPRS